MSDKIDDILDFDKKSRVIKSFAVESWGGEIPCPLRLVVNPYVSCSHRCAYCYVWSGRPQASKKFNFRESLKKDIERAKKFGATSQVIELSASTDPFQEIELVEKESLFAIRELLSGGFKVLIITKNPKLLLDPEYSDLLSNDQISIDVSIASLREGTQDGSIFNYNGPSGENKLETVAEIIKKGKEVRVRIDPVVPVVKGGHGQTSEELTSLVKLLSEIGVHLIISKTMRLSKDMPEYIIKLFLDYYKENGSLIGNHYALSPRVRKEMLLPIYQACEQYGVKFCPCFDFDVFDKEKTYSCHVPNEPEIYISDIMNSGTDGREG